MIFAGCTGGSGGVSAVSVSGPGGVSAGGAASSGCKGAGNASEGASSGGSGSGSDGCSSSSGPGCGSVSGGCAGAENSSSGKALWASWAACSAWACAPLTAGPAASTSAKAKLTNRFQTECFISAAFLSGRVAFAWFVYAVCPAYALMVPERVCSIWSESVLGA